MGCGNPRNHNALPQTNVEMRFEALKLAVVKELRARHGTLNLQYSHPYRNMPTELRRNEIDSKLAKPNPNHYPYHAKNSISTEFFHKRKKK